MIDLDYFNNNGHSPFKVSVNSDKMLRCLNNLDYGSFKNSEKFGSNMVEVSSDPTYFISHPYFLPTSLRKLYFDMFNTIMPIALERGFSVKHKDIRFVVNRCKRGYYKNWHHDNDGKTSLVVLAFFTDGGEPEEKDGGKFEIKSAIETLDSKNEILGSYMPISGDCIAIDTQTSNFIHRGEMWRSKEKVRYFIRLVFRENES